MKYLTLLRGINVGGNNIIKMSALKAAFEGFGFTDVKTYIQSGNVVFSSPSRSVSQLAAQIEKGLAREFGYDAKVVVISSKNLAEVVAAAPPGFGKNPSKYRYDVIFVRAPLAAKVAYKDFQLREGVDAGAVGRQVIYFSRLISQATKSKLSKIVALPSYKNMTIRNWNTTTKLLALMATD